MRASASWLSGTDRSECARGLRKQLVARLPAERGIRAAAPLAVVALVALVGLHARHHFHGDSGLPGSGAGHRRRNHLGRKVEYPHQSERDAGRQRERLLRHGSTCLDGGDCAFISDICEDNLDNIGGNPGMSSGASQIGYLNPGVVSVDGDRPYSGHGPAARLRRRHRSIMSSSYTTRPASAIPSLRCPSPPSPASLARTGTTSSTSGSPFPSRSRPSPMESRPTTSSRASRTMRRTTARSCGTPTR